MLDISWRGVQCVKWKQKKWYTHQKKLEMVSVEEAIHKGGNRKNHLNRMQPTSKEELKNYYMLYSHVCLDHCTFHCHAHLPSEI